MMKQSIDYFESPLEARVDNLLHFSGIVNRFMNVLRATIRGDHQETDGEHSLHLQFIATSYAAKYHPELDCRQSFLVCTSARFYRGLYW